MTSDPEVVLVHGAGETATAWDEVRQQLQPRSYALDLIGRGRHPFDLPGVTLDLAVGHALQDVEEATSGPIVLVAHSIGGAVTPGLIRGLRGRVVHLVHIAAVAAPDGELPLATASQEFARRMLAAADHLRREMSNATYTQFPSEVPSHLVATADQAAVTRIDSLNLGCAATSWVGVDPLLPRTFVQPLRDRLYLPDAQERLAAAVQADEVLTVDAGHNVARSNPGEIVDILEKIVARHQGATKT